MADETKQMSYQLISLVRTASWSRGGKRPNAGRPKGSNVFGESTKVVRIPLSRVDEVKALLLNPATRIPLFASKVPAGFPSPLDDYIESHLDLNEYLIKHSAATFMVGAIGDSMTGAGIFSGDILVVDRSLPPETGRIYCYCSSRWRIDSQTFAP